MIGKSILAQLLPAVPVVDGIAGKSAIGVIVDELVDLSLPVMPPERFRELMYRAELEATLGIPSDMLTKVHIELDLTKDVEAMMRGMMREFVVKLIDDNREMLVRENPVQKIKRSKRGNKHTPKWSRWS